ncbi:MAG TPA: coniferyl aldehyde dehydrogenase [Nevskiaceae bacterium]|nr:coniferyl aldehyde dehydrogenase [Nevskiaceae bacterium]
MNDLASPATLDASARMRAALDASRSAFLAEGPPSAKVRIDRIDRLIAIMVDNADRLVETLREDYGHRSSVQSVFAEVLGPLPGLKHSRKHLAEWMRPQRRPAGPLAFVGAKAWIEWQPLGVVGVISPWNFPTGLALQPMAQVFAAGNRGMLKLSELVPRTSDLIREACEKAFDPTELAVFTGGPDVGAAFSRLPFDHLLFTGATSVAAHVLHAAADNLVPVTLELGGKSPVVVGTDADLLKMATRVCVGKTMNAGQLCLTPDYLLVPAGREAATVEALTATFTRMFPRLVDNDDYGSIVNARHHARVVGLREDARAKGAQIIEINPANEDFSKQPAHKIPPTLVLGANDSMKILQEEIFGPLLPILPYQRIEDACGYINARPKPLAAYYFGADGPARRYFLARTYSGGVTLNDVVLHCATEDLPFGGVGASGMGYYHGRSGFEQFSHAKAVVDAPTWWSPNQLIGAPYGERLRKGLAWMLRSERKSVAARLGR